MDPDLKKVAEHMRIFGFEILGRAIYDATFNEMMSPFSHVLSVVHAAHGAEIIIKARIAEEHPLLIFKNFPKSKTTEDLLDFGDLFDEGRTYTYSELPEVLWATTGYRIKELGRFQEFGSLRNGLVHFAVPKLDAANETLKFIFEVLDPIVWDFWDETFVDYSSSWDDVIIGEGYLKERLQDLKINIHPKTRKLLDEIDKIS